MSNDKRTRNREPNYNPNRNEVDPRDYADSMRKHGPQSFDRSEAPPEETSLVAPDVNPAEVGLDVFNLEGTDIVTFDARNTRRELAARGYVMVERYLALEPGQGTEAFLLGWSGCLIPDVQDPTKLRYMRKLHLELKSGARVSMLEAAQLAGLFTAKFDGSESAFIFRGGESIKNGRRMGQWECHINPAMRGATHESNKAYASVASTANLHYRLSNMTSSELARVENAPPGLIEPYVAACRQRELDAEIAKRAAAASATEAAKA